MANNFIVSMLLPLGICCTFLALFLAHSSVVHCASSSRRRSLARNDAEMCQCGQHERTSRRVESVNGEQLDTLIPLSNNGQVSHAYSQSRAQCVVLKRRAPKQEVKMLGWLHGQAGIVQLYNFENGNIVLELAQGDLYSVLQQGTYLGIGTAKAYISDIVLGLYRTHRWGCHMDLKAPNVGVFAHQQAKLLDYGSSCVFSAVVQWLHSQREDTAGVRVCQGADAERGRCAKDERDLNRLGALLKARLRSSAERTAFEDHYKVEWDCYQQGLL